MNLQTEINELKAELNELNRLKQQEAYELAEIEYDIFQMESNFLQANNPIRPLIIKGLSLSPENKKQMILNSSENINNDSSSRIFSASSLTSKFALDKINKLASKKVTHATSQLQIKQQNEANLFIKQSSSLPIVLNESENHDQNVNNLNLVKIKLEEMPYVLRRERRSLSKRKL